MTSTTWRSLDDSMSHNVSEPSASGGAGAVGGGNEAMPDRSLKTSQHVQYLR